MFATNPYRFLLMLLIALPLTLAACDSSDPDDEPEPEPTPVAPNFNVLSEPVVFNDGTAGLVFSAIPDADVVLVRVEITNPRNQNQTFNAQQATVVRGEEVALQDPGIGYVRVSGTWTFTFVGRRATGDQDSFEVIETIEVSA
jgi:hypothetical protein